MRWGEMRIRLIKTLYRLGDCQAFLLKKEDRHITIRLILKDDASYLLLQQIESIDDLIESVEPELYKHHIFDYEVWTKGDWRKQSVKKLLERQSAD